MPLIINYYISGHGYGHATRSAKVVEALLEADVTTTITVVTTAPSHLFTPSDRLKITPRAVDSAIIQPQPYTIDASTSFRNLRDFLQDAESKKWQENATALLQQTRCNLIIADAPCPLAWNGKSHHIPSILLSNFSFDAIFEELLQYLPAKDSTSGHLVEKLKAIYADYSYVVRLPGYITFPFVESHWTAKQKAENVIDSPLVFRQARRTRSETLAALGIPQERHHQIKILLVQFGGQIVSASSDTKPKLPKGWICLSSSAPPNDTDFVTFPSDVYSPDLVAAADMILGKIGYGTVSECIGMNKPLIYVRRPMFAEEPGLQRYMQDNGVCSEISVADYEKGAWDGAIEDVYTRHSAEREARGIVEEGSKEVAEIILKLAS